MSVLTASPMSHAIVHPYEVPPRDPTPPTYTEADPLPASSLRALGWPEEAIPQWLKDREPTYAVCRTTYPARRCPCGAYAVQWQEDAHG